MNHVNTMLCCFVLCLNVFKCYFLSALMYLDRSTYTLCLLYVRMLDIDAGASPTTSKHGTNENTFWHMMNCLKCFEV
jgi:hypothetical protein